MVMTETEKEIVAINAAARKRGLSYGQFVAQATAAELMKATGKKPPKKTEKEKKQKK